MSREYLELNRCEYEMGALDVIKAAVDKQGLTPDVCACKDEPRCADDSCINRVRKVECLPTCNNCHNQRIRRGQFCSQITERKVEECPAKGYGLFATDRIFEDDMVIEYIGWVTQNFPEENSSYVASFKQLNSVFVDAMYYGNRARFANHSHSPNLKLEEWSSDGTLRLVLVALRDIDPNEELTFNYMWIKSPGDETNIECFCGAENCPKMMNLPAKSRKTTAGASKVAIVSKKKELESKRMTIKTSTRSNSIAKTKTAHDSAGKIEKEKQEFCTNIGTPKGVIYLEKKISGDVSMDALKDALSDPIFEDLLKTSFLQESNLRKSMKLEDINAGVRAIKKFLVDKLGCSTVDILEDSSFEQFFKTLTTIEQAGACETLYLVVIPGIHVNYKMFFQDIKSFKNLMNDLLHPIFGNKSNQQHKININLLWSESLGNEHPSKESKHFTTTRVSPLPIGSNTRNISLVSIQMLVQMAEAMKLNKRRIVKAALDLIKEANNNSGKNLSLCDDYCRPTVTFTEHLDISNARRESGNPAIGLLLKFPSSKHAFPDLLESATINFFGTMYAKIITGNATSEDDIGTFLKLAGHQAEALASKKLILALECDGYENGIFINKTTYCSYARIHQLIAMSMPDSVNDVLILSYHSMGSRIPSQVVTLSSGKAVIKKRKIEKQDAKINVLSFCPTAEINYAIKAQRSTQNGNKAMRNLRKTFEDVTESRTRVNNILDLYQSLQNQARNDDFPSSKNQPAKLKKNYHLQITMTTTF